MELLNSFRMEVPIDEAWAVLTNIEGIAPCMPGAQLTSVEDGVYSGTVKVKVGPIAATYRGKASFAEKDDVAYRAVIDASGRDSRGAGNANAMITLELSPDGAGTAAAITTDLKVTGKVAQFGRGVMADISEKLLGQFVECLEAKLVEGDSAEDTSAGVDPDSTDADVASDSAGGAATESTTSDFGKAATDSASSRPVDSDSGSAARRIDMPEAKPVDLLDAAGAPVLKRAAPFLLVLLVLFLLRRRRQ